MKTALFLMVPHLSHYYPTYGLAHLLVQQGYTVVYCGTEEFRPVIEQEGFDFKSVLYTEEIVVKRLRVAFGFWLKMRLDSSCPKMRYRQFLTSIRSVEALVENVSPSVTFLDDTLGHYYTCLAGRARIIQLCTKVSPRQRPIVPPLDSFFIPKGLLLDRTWISLLWALHIGKRRFNSFLQKLIFRGCSDIDFLRRYERKRGVVWRKVRNERVSFYDGLADTPTIVLAPLSFEFKASKPNLDEYYFYLPARRDEHSYFSTEYVHFVDRLMHHKQNSNVKFIYVALGSLSLAFAEIAYPFLRNIIEAFTGDESIEVLLVTGGLNLNVEALPSNICLLPVAPQMDALRHCDAMITHGGLGSIKECIAAGVPMLVYPLNTDVDQPGNSARVVSHKLGLRGKITDSPASIRRKVHKVLIDDGYRQNCRRMQQGIIKQSEGAGEVLVQLGLLKMDLIRSHKSIFHS